MEKMDSRFIGGKITVSHLAMRDSKNVVTADIVC